MAIINYQSIKDLPLFGWKFAFTIVKNIINNFSKCCLYAFKIKLFSVQSHLLQHNMFCDVVKLES